MTASNPLPDGARIDVALVRRLIAAQFPRWAELPAKPVEDGGWDNRTFHLGQHMTVWLPNAAQYALQVEKEHRSLPKLAPLLPLPVPVPLAKGAPAEGYPRQWSVYRWLEAGTATVAHRRSAPVCHLAGRIVERAAADRTGRRPATRAAQLSPRRAADGLRRRDPAGDCGPRRRIDADAALTAREAALGPKWDGISVWFHGDVAVGNLLVRNGRLGAVIDFGTSGVGDPACDLAIVWTLSEGRARPRSGRPSG